MSSLVPTSQTLVLENALLRAEFDGKTGALTGLLSKQTGWQLQRRAALGLSFELLVPLPERRNNPVHGAGQRCACVELSADGTQLRLVWVGMDSLHGGRLDITLTAVITLTDAGLTFATEVQNRSPYIIESVNYPCLGDITPTAPGETLKRMTNGYSGMASVELLPIFHGNKGYFGVDSPQMWGSFPYTTFLLLGSATQGIYVGSHDHTLDELVQYPFTLLPGMADAYDGAGNRGVVPPDGEIDGHPVHLCMACVHFSFVQPGETRALSPIVLQPYVGSWHAGADIYKAWRRTWCTPTPTPAWAREVHAWQQLHINSPEDELRRPFAELVDIGAECARHGVKAIQLVGWNYGGQDRGNPVHDPDPRLGGWEALQRAIAEIQAMGVQIILFAKFTWADRGTDRYREELIDYAVKDPYGEPAWHCGYQYQTPAQLADLHVRRFAPMCMLSAEWRAIADREFTKCLELGAAGILFDECCHHGWSNWYCFDTMHGHRVPAFVYQGDALLEAGFRAISAERDPNFLFAGEAPYDVQYRHYHLNYTRISEGHVPMQRYIDPDLGIMVAVTGFDDRYMLNLCLLYRYIISYEPFNFKGRLEEYPHTLAYGEQIDALRRRYQAHLWDAEFRDTLGAAVTVDDKPHALYTVYRQRNTGQRAVVVVNPTQEPLTARVALEGEVAPLHCASPEAPEAVPCSGTVIIPARSAVVVMEE